MIFCGSRLAGISTTERMPALAAAAATALARFPVDGQARTLWPISSAAARATATTRSLNEGGGLPRSPFTPRRPQPDALRQPVRAHQAGEARLGVRPAGHVGRDRQQARVPPDARRSGLDGLPGQRRVVVADLKRPETLGAGVLRSQLAGLAALAAGQSGGVAEAG